MSGWAGRWPQDYAARPPERDPWYGRVVSAMYEGLAWIVRA